MKVYQIIVSGGVYEDYYERDYLFSTEEKAKEFATSYRTSDNSWEDEHISLREVELDVCHPASYNEEKYFHFGDRYYHPRVSSIVTEEPRWVSSKEHYEIAKKEEE